MAAYPEDRILDRRTSLRLIAATVKAGVEPDDLKQAIKAYAKESEGYTRSKVCFSDNWFKMRPMDLSGGRRVLPKYRRAARG